ncbi:hypothetical protein [Streptomyces tsukubensis]|uniref:Secreted protein n=1 Tax=Streptomyces tsukubensis TaxID=83656 RepID=A0A1V4A1Q0_9ACTN|nr:hypothetical protein [Streptomyces tsukubensis]OON73009.1 hypothetical protein B1H18_28035 [Streptomyces tsukubensis]QFR93992.1 hypothetical protein GBW32_14135 [Streptomyces tsukubensis]
MNKKLLVAAVVCAVAVCVAVALPTLRKHDGALADTVSDHVFHERSKTFASTHDAPKSGDGEGQFVLPGWVPEDVTNIEEKIQTDGGGKLLRFTLGDDPLKLDAKDCVGGAFNERPSLDADWWADDVKADSAKVDCTEEFQFRVAVKGHEAYAWTNGARSDGIED